MAPAPLAPFPRRVVSIPRYWVYLIDRLNPAVMILVVLVFLVVFGWGKCMGRCLSHTFSSLKKRREKKRREKKMNTFLPLLLRLLVLLHLASNCSLLVSLWWFLLGLLASQQRARKPFANYSSYRRYRLPRSVTSQTQHWRRRESWAYLYMRAACARLFSILVLEY